MKSARNRIAPNKASTRLVLGASVLALGLIAMGVGLHKQQQLPATPTLAYKQMLQAMIHKDKWALWRLSSVEMVRWLGSFQGEEARETVTYDFLAAKGIAPQSLTEPWGLWQQWAKTVNPNKIKTFAWEDTWTIQTPLPKEVSIGSGNPDGLTFTFEQRGTGWLLVRMVPTLGANS
jgi:hypothetical protein